MLSVTNTTLDLLVLQLVLHGLRVGIGALVLGILSPVDARSEDDVLAHGGGIGGRTGGVLCAEAKLAPGFAVGDSGIYGFGVGDEADATSGFDLLALIIVAICDDGLGSVLVGNGLRRRELGGNGLLDIIIVGPVVPIFLVGGVS